MRKSRIPASLQGSPDEIEAAFYEALQTADIDKLMACWADEDDIVCIHPGGPRVIGAGAIRATFEAMFNNGAPGWLPGGNLQPIWPALYARRSHGPRPEYRRERWSTPDQDFVDVDWLIDEIPRQPLLVLFHGLEGSSRSHYAEAFADFS